VKGTETESVCMFPTPTIQMATCSYR